MDNVNNNEQPANALGDNDNLQVNGANPFNDAADINMDNVKINAAIDLGNKNDFQQGKLNLDLVNEGAEQQNLRIVLNPGLTLTVTGQINGPVDIVAGMQNNIENVLHVENNMDPCTMTHNADTGQLDIQPLGDDILVIDNPQADA